MRILCIGNCTEDTDHRVTEIAEKNNSVNRGLISELDGEIDFDCLQIHNGYYHTSFVDLSFESVKKCVGYFDSLFVIDQPIHTWNTATEFYNTVNLAMQLDNVEWQNVATKQDFLYWKEQVKNNKSLCIWPFIQMNFVGDSGARLCCKSNKLLDKIHSIDDFEGHAYQTVKQSMLDNKKLPEYCSACYNVESKGIESARIQETIEWATRLNLRHVDDLKSIKTPVCFEIGLGNKCNLMCRMCSPDSSNLIEKEYKQLGIIASSSEYSNVPLKALDDLLYLDNIEKLYFTGGEPTTSKEFLDFLQSCINLEKTNFLLQINTNCHKISKRFIDLIKHFSRVEIFVSVDAYGKANDYVRWNSNWNVLNRNIQLLIDADVVVSFNVSVSLYSIFSLSRLMAFLDKTYPGHYVSFSLVTNMYAFIVEYDDEFINDLYCIQDLSLYSTDANLFKNYIDGFIKNAEESRLDKPKLKKFFEENDQLDKSRNSRLKDYIPELEKYRELI